jgi:hypothetical protein
MMRQELASNEGNRINRTYVTSGELRAECNPGKWDARICRRPVAPISGRRDWVCHVMASGSRGPRYRHDRDGEASAISGGAATGS